jgi:phage terminase large subunit-like protein
MESWGFYELMRRQTTCPTASEPRYYVGVDLGQSRDPTAIAVVRRVEPPASVLENDFGLKPKPNYAPGSVEWQEEQRRLKNEAASG